MSANQKIAAWLLSVFAAIGVVVNGYYYLFPQLEPDGTNRLLNMVFCSVGFLLSLPSIFSQTDFTRGIQVASIAIAGVFSFTGGVGGQYFGTFIFILAIIAARSFGFYSCYLIPKIIGTAVTIFLLILAAINGPIESKWPLAMIYTIFDGVGVFLIFLYQSEREDKIALDQRRKEQKMLELLKNAAISMEEAVEVMRAYADNKTMGQKNGND